LQVPTTAENRDRRKARHGASRVLGFEQHLGVWAALLCAIGWAIAFDHAAYSLRYRYADRAQAWMSQWRPNTRAGNWFIATARKSVGHRSRPDRSYPIFLMTNTASTFAGSAVFVGVGYLLTARWYDGRTDWTSAAAGLAVTGVIVGIALSAGHRFRCLRSMRRPGSSPQSSDIQPARSG
jgi:hypothetical protein